MYTGNGMLQQEGLTAEKQGFINLLSTPEAQAGQDLNAGAREDGSQTEGRIMAAVERDSLAFCHVPPSARTARVCRGAVGKDGFNIKYVPRDLRTEDICKLAVEQNGLALVWVPLSARTAEVCRAAVGNCGLALGNVPEELKTRELCLVAVANSGEEALKYVPEALKTENVFLPAGGASPESVRNAKSPCTRTSSEWLVKDSSLSRFFGSLDVQETALLVWALQVALNALLGRQFGIEATGTRSGAICEPAAGVAEASGCCTVTDLCMSNAFGEPTTVAKRGTARCPPMAGIAERALRGFARGGRRSLPEGGAQQELFSAGRSPPRGD